MSVINKMLNDLDDRQDTEQAQEDISFLTPTTKPKKKWLVTLVISIVLGLGAVWGTYYFYEDLLKLAGVKVPAKPKILTPEEIQARMEQVAREKAAAEQAKTQGGQDTAQTANNPSDEPELIILKPNNADGKPTERASTLSVVAVESGQLEPVQNTQTSVQSPGANNDGQATKDMTAQTDVTDVQGNDAIGNNDDGNENVAFVSPSSEEKTRGAPTADPGKMQVKKVVVSPRQRAQKSFQKGKEESRQGMIKEAIELYQEAIRYQPDHQQARSELAALYYGRGQARDALATLDGGLELDPSNLGWSLLAAKIHYKRTNYSAAFSYLQLPVETYDHVEYVALRATTAYKLKEYLAAREAYQQLTVADPGNGRWWLGLGTAYESMGMSVEAVRAYRKSLKLSNISSSSRQFVMSRLQRLAN